MIVRRKVLAALVLAVCAGACSEDDSDSSSSTSSPPTAVEQPSSGPVVRPGRANWSTGYLQAAIYATLLGELGYDVADPAVHEYPPSEAYLAMAEGEFDFWPNGWFSQHFTWFDRQLDDGSVVDDHVVVLGNEIDAGALEGLLITKSVADEHGIESLAQINDDPRLAALFDTDSDGLGEVRGCPDDWTCDDIITEMIEFNEWSNLEHVGAGYPGLVAASIEAVERGEPVIQYSWSPSGYLTQLVPGDTALWLSVGSHDNVLDGTTAGEFDFSHADAAPLGDTCTDDPCWIGWEVADIRVAANKDFANANPVAAALFEAVELNVADIATQNVRYDNGENTEADIERHAQQWIESNRPLVDTWLETASSADS